MKIKYLLLCWILSIYSSLLFAQEAEFNWVTSTFVEDNELTKGVSTDSEGYVYSAGIYRSDGDFDEGFGVDSLVHLGFSNVFIKKNDLNGNHIWAKRISSEYGSAISEILVDSNDDVLIYGNIYGNTTFLPSVNSFEINTDTAGAFILKINSTGTILWYKKIENVKSSQLEIDYVGNIILTGEIYDNTDLDPGVPVFQINYDITDKSKFIVKITPNGDFIWGKAFGSNFAEGLGVDYSNNIYLSGSYSDSTDFDPGPNFYTLPAENHTESLFVLKLNENGNFVWAKGMNTNNLTFQNPYMHHSSLAVDPEGNSYSVGYFSGIVDFNPNGGVNTLSTDIDIFHSFIVKLDSLGNYQWAKAYGSDQYSLIESITLDNYNDLYLTGTFYDQISFVNPDSLNIGINPDLISNGDGDCFLLKINDNGDNIWHKGFGSSNYDSGHTIHVDEQKSIYLGGSFNTSNSDSMYFDNVNDTLVPSWDRDAFTITYSQCHSQVIDHHTSCNPLTWINGETYNNSNNTAIHILSNINGCDSIVKLNYTRYYPTYSTDIIESCDKIIWIDGNTYLESNNTATYVLTNSVGCDSVISLDLTIGVEDNTTNIIESTLSANLAGVNYQWLNCNTNYSIIPGETSPFFTPLNNGSYAVQITQNGCIDTSFCQSITTVGFLDDNELQSIKLYPNPSLKQFNIDLGTLQNVDMRILNDLGQTLLSKKNLPSGLSIINQNIPSGIYIIELSYNELIHHIKFIKQ